MASIYKELLYVLRGGCNTALDPSIIGEDQLQESIGMEYRPPRMGLFAVGGRTRADSGTILGNRTFGLVWSSWDNAPAVGYLVAFASPSATAFGYMGSAESDGDVVFSPLSVQFLNTGTHLWSASATAFADGCHYQNHWFYFNGVNRNLSLPSSVVTGFGAGGAWRAHGLIDVTATAFTNVTGAGGPSTLQAGAYDVWYSEISLSSVLLDGTAAKSGYSGTPQQVTLSASGLVIEITMPPTFPTNKGTILASVWASLPGGSFPNGFLIGSGALLSPGSIIYCTSQTLTEPYEVAAPVGGVPVSAWHEPPRAYSMRVFKDSLVCIDAEDRQFLRYSLPADPYNFPSINYIPVGETPWQDTLNAIENCGEVLLAFSTFYGFRVNYLPRHTDSEDIAVGRGDCYDRFSVGHGCVSPRGVAAVPLPGGAEVCLFVCRDGIHITDGERVGYLNEDFDWSVVALGSLTRCILKNNPKRHRVEFYYIDTSGNYQRADFYYHPSFIRKGPEGLPKLPWLGPTRVPGLAAALGTFSNDWQMWSGDDSNPRVWIEATGIVDNAQLVDGSGTIQKRWRTKNYYLAGVHGDFELYKPYTHQAQITASGTYPITLLGTTDEQGNTFSATSTVDQSLKGAQPHPALHNRLQHFSLRGVKDDGGTWQELNYLVFVVKGAQELHSAKSTS